MFETKWFGVAVVAFIPITEAVVVVPVPILLVKLRIVFEVRFKPALLEWIPIIWDATPVAVSWIELATVPPILFWLPLNNFVVEVFALIP